MASTPPQHTVAGPVLRVPVQTLELPEGTCPTGLGDSTSRCRRTKSATAPRPKSKFGDLIGRTDSRPDLFLFVEPLLLDGTVLDLDEDRAFVGMRGCHLFVQFDAESRLGRRDDVSLFPLNRNLE